MTPMVCKKCGAEVPKGSFYCNVCGAEIQIVSEYNPEDDMIASLIGGDDSDAPSETPDPVEQKKPVLWDRLVKRRKALIGAAVLTGALIVGIVFVAFFGTRYRAEEEEDLSFTHQMELALKAFEERDYEMAVAHFDKALVAEPDRSEVMEYLAQCYENLKEPSAAESIYLSLIEQNPSELSYFEQLVRLYESQNDFEKIRDLSGLSEDPKVEAYLAAFGVPQPTFSHESGTYDDDITVSILANEDEIIYYTTDGSDPIQKGLIYTGVVRFEGEGRYLLKAVSQNSINFFSDVTEAEYVIEYKAPPAPKGSLPSGVYNGQQVLSFEVPEDCTCYYTLDGTNPSTRSIPYETAIILPAGGQYVVTAVYVSDHGKVGKSSQYTYLTMPTIMPLP